MIKFPLYFEVEAHSGDKINVPWNAKAADLQPIVSAIPPEFSGPGGGYSPEDLFALSVLNCIIAMFKVYCEKSSVSFEEIQGKAKLTVNKSPSDSSFWMEQIEFTLDVKGASDKEKVRSILDTAIKHCPVSNSIKSGKTFHIQVS